jgi:sulfate adenylyltransferase subunit 2
MNKLDSANAVIENIAKQKDECILFCSLGKDSLVVLDLIYPHFKRIVCVFMYFVKDLEHVDMYIRYIKARYPKIEFVQVPHWNLTYIYRGGMYCVPNPEVKLLKLADVVNTLRIKYDIDYCFLGMKKADGMNRRLMLNGYVENSYENKGLVYPLAEWTQKDVLSYMKMHRLPEPVRYGKNASNGVGFNLDCFLWLRENYPQDLEKIYEAFPLSRRILYEYDYKLQNS